MPCHYPLTAYRTPDGGRLSFKEPRNYTERLSVPCGQCRSCRLTRSGQWAIRCVHEASLHKENAFITLTYNDDNVPLHGSLQKKHFQDFMKRFRKKTGAKIRYYYCGEYGEKLGRPHYHALIFGYDFPDKKTWRKNDNGDQIWRSTILESLWTFGNSEIGSVTFDSAAYVAGYIHKKVLGKNASQHYCVGHDPETGELHYKLPEYTDMSRDGGIGKNWLLKYTSDVYNHDYVVHMGKKMPPPRYYDSQYEIINATHLEQIKHERFLRSQKFLDDLSPERLHTREQVMIAQSKIFKRKLK